jgi:hypothetical protein
MEYIKLFLPIGWVVVSAFVGVLLYRTSDALYESLSKSEASRKRLKLTGSIVIAAVTFLGIYYVTPRGALDPRPAGMQYVPVVEVQRLLDAVTAVQDQALALSACLSINASRDCSGQVQDIQSSAAVLEREARQIEGAGKGEKGPEPAVPSTR